MVAVEDGRTYRFIFLGSKYVDLVVGKLTRATDNNPHHANIDGKRSGMFSSKIIIQNIDLAELEPREYQKSGDIFYLIRHDSSGDMDSLQIPATTKAYFKALEEQNNQLQQQVATLQRKIRTIAGDDKFKRRQIEESKHFSDLRKAEFAYRSDYWDNMPTYPIMRR